MRAVKANQRLGQYILELDPHPKEILPGEEVPLEDLEGKVVMPIHKIMTSTWSQLNDQELVWCYKHLPHWGFVYVIETLRAEEYKRILAQLGGNFLVEDNYRRMLGVASDSLEEAKIIARTERPDYDNVFCRIIDRSGNVVLFCDVEGLFAFENGRRVSVE